MSTVSRGAESGGTTVVAGSAGGAATTAGGGAAGNSLSAISTAIGRGTPIATSFSTFRSRALTDPVGSPTGWVTTITCTGATCTCGAASCAPLVVMPLAAFMRSTQLISAMVFSPLFSLFLLSLSPSPGLYALLILGTRPHCARYAQPPYMPQLSVLGGSSSVSSTCLAGTSSRTRGISSPPQKSATCWRFTVPET